MHQAVTAPALLPPLVTLRRTSVKISERTLPYGQDSIVARLPRKDPLRNYVVGKPPSKDLIRNSIVERSPTKASSKDSGRAGPGGAGQ